jgi:hypothetical protein
MVDERTHPARAVRLWLRGGRHARCRAIAPHVQKALVALGRVLMVLALVALSIVGVILLFMAFCIVVYVLSIAWGIFMYGGHHEPLL